MEPVRVCSGRGLGGRRDQHKLCYPIPSYTPILTRDVKTHSHVKAFWTWRACLVYSVPLVESRVRLALAEKKRGKETAGRDRVRGESIVYLFSCQLTVDSGGLYVHIITFISRFIRPALGTVTSFQFPVKQLSIPNKYCVICFTW